MRRMPFCRYAKKDCFVLMRRMPVLFQCGECPFCLRVENACFVPMRRCVFLSKCKECLFCRNAENACLILMAENACFVPMMIVLVLFQRGECLFCLLAEHAYFVPIRRILFLVCFRAEDNRFFFLFFFSLRICRLCRSEPVELLFKACNPR